ncbi:MAG: hypothetical protein U1A27_12795 [Phycisphaerae bacterium]
MMKWLRTHNRQVLAILTALILVSWLIGEPLRQFLSPDPSKAAVGEAFASTITNASLVPAQNTTTILEGLGIAWRHIGGGATAGQEPLKIEHWYMLSTEAARAGVAVSDDEVHSMLAQLAPSGVLDAIRDRYKVSLDQIGEAIADFLRVRRYQELNIGSIIPSEQQIRHYIRDTQERVAVRMVSLRARDFIIPNEPVDPAEVAAQFEKYKNRLPLQADEIYGYQYPRRARIEYLLARVDDVVPKITLSEDEIRHYWRKNKTNTRYTRISFDTPGSQPSSAPSGNPTRVAMTFAEARPLVEADLKRQRAVSRVRDAMIQVASELSKPWLGLPVGEDGYKTGPDEVRDPNYLVAAKARFEAKLGFPLVYQKLELMSGADLGNDPQIGKMVSIGESKDRLSISEFAFRVPGQFDAAKAGETALRLALYQTPDQPLFVERDGGPADQMVFRVLETTEPAVPKSIDEVRAKVEEDVRFSHGYQRALSRAHELYALARNIGFDKAIEYSPDIRNQVLRPFDVPLFARRESMQLDRDDPQKFITALMNNEPTLQPPALAVLGESRSAAFVDGCFAMTEPGWTSPTFQLATSHPAMAPPPGSQPSDKFNVIPLARLGIVPVVELTDHQPVRQDTYTQYYSSMGRSMLMSQRNAAAMARWFDPHAIESRCGFRRHLLESGKHVPVAPSEPPPAAPDTM